MEELGKKRITIIKLRKKRSLTQIEVANYLGISSSFYSQIETGRRSPGRENAIKICDFYGIDIRKL